jgi:hypothetical protein
MPEDKPASQGIAGLAESFEKVAKSAGLLALIFLIVFGCCYKLGEDRGQDAGQQIRQQQGKPVLKTLLTGEAVLFWKDEKIIQGGLYGLLTVAILLTYVLFMITIRKPSHESLGAWAANKLRFPNVMSAAVAIYMLLGLRTDLAEAIVVMLSAALAVCSWRWRHRLAIQIMVLVGQTLLVSFLFGENRGIESTDLEHHYPLVEVQDTNGGVTKGLRLLKTGDSEYRFVDSGGREKVIPKAQIRAVSLAPETAQGPK